MQIHTVDDVFGKFLICFGFRIVFHCDAEVISGSVAYFIFISVASSNLGDSQHSGS